MTTKVREKIAKKLDEFLAERRKSDGGWAEVTDDDLRQLYSLVLLIISAKCEADPDGDRPIECYLVNRRKERMPYFRPVPYSAWQLANRATPEELEGQDEREFDATMSNLQTAVSEMDRLMQCRRHRQPANP